MIAVDDRNYQRYASLRAKLKKTPEVKSLKRECLDLHFDLFYRPQPIKHALPRLVPHPVRG
jgi:hypothetical protein